MDNAQQQAIVEVIGSLKRALIETAAFYEAHPTGYVLVVSGSYQAFRIKGERIALIGGKQTYWTASRWQAERNADELTEKYRESGSNAVERVDAITAAEYKLKHTAWLQAQIVAIEKGAYHAAD